MRPVIVRVVGRDGEATGAVADHQSARSGCGVGGRWPTAIAGRRSCFYRWLKCRCSARHLIATDPNGVRLEMYAAPIVSLLIVLRTGREPTKRTFETSQFQLLGWVSDEEPEGDSWTAARRREEAK